MDMLHDLFGKIQMEKSKSRDIQYTLVSTFLLVRPVSCEKLIITFARQIFSKKMEGKPIRIGCYSAFWGDSISAAEQLVKKEGSNLDYLVADYLAEVTMGILARSRKAAKGGAGAGGYVREFITMVLSRLLPDILENNIKVVTNAGGLDPLACKQAIETLLRESGVPDGKVTVAAVSGDDLFGDKILSMRKNDLVREFSAISNAPSDSKDPNVDVFPADFEKLLSINAYLGAIPVARALSSGAQIIVTGRVVDSALVLGPLLHEFKWDPTRDWDKLAAGSLAGHIIECGCHATGGNFTDWELSAFSLYGGWSNMGYPIVECYSSGDFVVTKPQETGGLVSVATVSEQMVYEVLDPGAYLLPDVILDLRYVKLTQIGQDRVLVTGARGRKPTKWLKCSGVYVDGYKMSGMLVIGGVDAWKKALALGQSIITRTRILLERLGMEDFRDVNIEVIGAEHIYGNHSVARNAREVVLRITVVHNVKQALAVFGMELAPSATCMAPGITGGGGGRPHPSPNLTHFSCLIPKTTVPAFLTVGKGETQKVSWEVEGSETSHEPPQLENAVKLGEISSAMDRVPLIRLAYGRSGDKGDNANIGIIARDPAYYPYLKRSLTEEAVLEYMSHLCHGTVKRYELPGSHSLNFVLTKSLGGGGLSSLRIDRQGKTYAQILLSEFMVDVPTGTFAKI